MRLICNADRLAHTNELFKELYILKIPEFVQYKTAILMFHLFHGTLPIHLQNRFKDILGAYLCSPVPMFPGTYVPRFEDIYSSKPPKLTILSLQIVMIIAIFRLVISTSVWIRARKFARTPARTRARPPKRICMLANTCTYIRPHMGLRTYKRTYAHGPIHVNLNKPVFYVSQVNVFCLLICTRMFMAY